MHVSLCMSYFFSYVHNRLLSCFSGPLYMYQAFVFINEEICSPALAHDKEKKNPACEKIEQRQAISSTSRTQIFSKHKIYFCKLSTHFIADFNTYGSILIQLLHFSIEVSKTSNGKSQVTLSYHTSSQNPICGYTTFLVCFDLVQCFVCSFDLRFSKEIYLNPSLNIKDYKKFWSITHHAH